MKNKVEYVTYIIQDVEKILPYHRFYHTLEGIKTYKVENSLTYYWMVSKELSTDITNLGIEYDVISYAHGFDELDKIEEDGYYE